MLPDDFPIDVFQSYVDVAERYWRRQVPCLRTPAAEREELPWIVVDLQIPDVRVSLRNLAVANAIRRVQPARVLAVVGQTPEWYEVFHEYQSLVDTEVEMGLAGAHGVDAVLHVPALADARLHDRAAGTGCVPDILVGEHTVPEAAPSLSDDLRERIVRSTASRVWFTAELDEDLLTSERYRHLAERTAEMDRIYTSLLTGLDVLAHVTTHFTYDLWGVPVNVARQAEVPVLTTLDDGNLRLWAAFPDAAGPVGQEKLLDAMISEAHGDWFERRIWPARDALLEGADVVIDRVRNAEGNHWSWRSDPGARLTVDAPEDRARFRAEGLRTLGITEDRPVVGVFVHCFTDALDLTFRTFRSYAEWFRSTAEFAAQHPEYTWVFIDHPQQRLYERTEFFERTAAHFTGFDHVRFTQSSLFSRDVLLSMVDVATTFRGSVSLEFPCYGIPTVQAGPHAWSSSGFSTVAGSREEYWDLLLSVTAAVADGTHVAGRETMERARLWLWLLKSGADVPSALFPHFSVAKANIIKNVTLIRDAMLSQELDMDPLFGAVERMWMHRDPVVTRGDLALLHVACGSEGEPHLPVPEMRS